MNVFYRNAAEEFARRVTSALKNRIDSVVLYGSVGRGRATRGSDIDILVIAPDVDAIRPSLDETSNDFMYERGYAFFISTLYLDRDELQNLVRLGSPFIDAVLDQGAVLYDNGTLSTIRKRIPASC
ncbi:MAG: nucleotidyltransferase domain-containing protein [Dehalococcoidia bacterium]|nr:nucleotidyltransferase domain-containing protein [Dehalococcoidia bacterium]